MCRKICVYSWFCNNCSKAGFVIVQWGVTPYHIVYVMSGCGYVNKVTCVVVCNILLCTIDVQCVVVLKLLCTPSDPMVCATVHFRFGFNECTIKPTLGHCKESVILCFRG